MPPKYLHKVAIEAVSTLEKGGVALKDLQSTSAILQTSERAGQLAGVISNVPTAQKNTAGLVAALKSMHNGVESLQGQLQPGSIEIPGGKSPVQESPGKFKCATEGGSKTGQIKAAETGIQKTKDYIKQLANDSKPGSIWEKITPTQEQWNQYSSFPKSFEIDIKGQKFWVNPNASKHLMEMTSPTAEMRGTFDKLRSPWNVPAKELKMAHEAILEDFSAALQEATKNGIPYKQRLVVNNWQLEIGHSRIPNGKPTVIHARPLKY